MDGPGVAPVTNPGPHLYTHGSGAATFTRNFGPPPSSNSSSWRHRPFQKRKLSEQQSLKGDSEIKPFEVKSVILTSFNLPDRKPPKFRRTQVMGFYPIGYRLPDPPIKTKDLTASRTSTFHEQTTANTIANKKSEDEYTAALTSGNFGSDQMALLQLIRNRALPSFQGRLDELKREKEGEYRRLYKIDPSIPFEHFADYIYRHQRNIPARRQLPERERRETQQRARESGHERATREPQAPPHLLKARTSFPQMQTHSHSSVEGLYSRVFPTYPTRGEEKGEEEERKTPRPDPFLVATRNRDLKAGIRNHTTVLFENLKLQLSPILSLGELPGRVAKGALHGLKSASTTALSGARSALSGAQEVSSAAASGVNRLSSAALSGANMLSSAAVSGARTSLPIGVAGAKLGVKGAQLAASGASAVGNAVGSLAYQGTVLALPLVANLGMLAAKAGAQTVKLAAFSVAGLARALVDNLGRERTELFRYCCCLAIQDKVRTVNEQIGMKLATPLSANDSLQLGQVLNALDSGMHEMERNRMWVDESLISGQRNSIGAAAMNDEFVQVARSLSDRQNDAGLEAYLLHIFAQFWPTADVNYVRVMLLPTAAQVNYQLNKLWEGNQQQANEEQSRQRTITDQYDDQQNAGPGFFAQGPGGPVQDVPLTLEYQAVRQARAVANAQERNGRASFIEEPPLPLTDQYVPTDRSSRPIAVPRPSDFQSGQRNQDAVRRLHGANVNFQAPRSTTPSSRVSNFAPPGGQVIDIRTMEDVVERKEGVEEDLSEFSGLTDDEFNRMQMQSGRLRAETFRPDYEPPSTSSWARRNRQRGLPEFFVTRRI